MLREYEYELKNIAYSDEYKKIKEKNASIIFSSDHFIEEKEDDLGHGYKRVVHRYRGVIEDSIYHRTDNQIFDKNGKVIYKYCNINDEGEFCTLISHSNGIDYLFFRIDLYGYSTLNLTTMEDFHYIPAPTIQNGETFIWTQVHYNQYNDIFSVSGCYWACPSSTFLYEIKEPLVLFTRQVDFHYVIDEEYEIYDDVDFHRWNGRDLELSCINNKTNDIDIIVLKEKEYMLLLK